MSNCSDVPMIVYLVAGVLTLPVVSILYALAGRISKGGGKP